MTPNRWGLVAMFIWLFILAFAIWTTPAQAQRTYWVVPIDTLAIGRLKHTHVQVTGKVIYVNAETDGDIHVKVGSPSGRFIMAECIPKLPCVKPKVDSVITVFGITRWDPEHGWAEVHPVESWNYYVPAMLAKKPARR